MAAIKTKQLADTQIQGQQERNPGHNQVVAKAIRALLSLGLGSFKLSWSCPSRGKLPVSNDLGLPTKSFAGPQFNGPDTIEWFG